MPTRYQHGGWDRYEGWSEGVAGRIFARLWKAIRESQLHPIFSGQRTLDGTNMHPFVGAKSKAVWHGKPLTHACSPA